MRAPRRQTLRDGVREGARGLAAGLAAATAMSLTTAAQRRALPVDRGPVDYDASHHVPQAVGEVLGRAPRSRTEEEVYFALAHWGYGSAVSLAYPLLRRWLDDDARATLVFYLGCQAMAFTMLPALGGTPPPQRWSRRLVVTSLAQHAVYAGTVVAVHRAAGPRRGGVLGRG